MVLRWNASVATLEMLFSLVLLSTESLCVKVLVTMVVN